MIVIVMMLMVMMVMLIKWVIVVTIVQQALRYIRLATSLLPSKHPQTKSLQLVKPPTNSTFTISEMLPVKY
jgi:hypothetical protein